MSEEKTTAPGVGDIRYGHGHGAAALASHATRTAANSAAYLLPHLLAGQSLLDVGCGPGTITLDLAATLSPGRVVGLDYTDAPLVAAREEAARRGDTTTQFVVGDVSALDLPDDSFDVVHAHQVLHHLPDPPAALREMARVTRPGGLLAVRDADYDAMAWYPRLPGLDTWRRLFTTVQRSHGAEADAARRHRRWFREAGLEGGRFTTSTWTYADEKTCRWWGESQAARYGAEGFAAQVREVGGSDDDVAEIAAAWHAWGEDPDAWFVMVHGEVLLTVA